MIGGGIRIVSEYSKVLRIKPCDTLFFGSGRRFERSESTWVSSRLMPYPSVFYGAICGLMLAHYEEKKIKYLKRNENKFDPRDSLVMGNVYLYNEETGQTYMKAPLDLFISKTGQLEYFEIRKNPENIATSSRASYLFYSDKKIDEKFDDMYISINSFNNGYLIMDRDVEYLRSSDMTIPSYKVGIQRNSNYVAEESCLYRIDVTEFDNGKWSYLVEYNNDQWWDDSHSEPQQGYLKLGGENKPCQFYVEEKNDYIADRPRDVISQTGYVKMVITSPYLDTDILQWAYDSDELTDKILIYSGQIGRIEHIGGYDMVKRKSKCMHQAFPQGSILIIGSQLFKNKTMGAITDIIQEQMINKDNEIDENRYKYNDGYNQFQVIPLMKQQLKQ